MCASITCPGNGYALSAGRRWIPGRSADIRGDSWHLKTSPSLSWPRRRFASSSERPLGVEVTCELGTVDRRAHGPGDRLHHRPRHRRAPEPSLMPRRIPVHDSNPHPATSPDAVYRSQVGRRQDNLFYKSTVWRRLRAAFLAANPLCDECSRHGKTEVATDVHHLQERKTHPDLSLDWDNLQALCRRCHNAQRGRH